MESDILRDYNNNPRRLEGIQIMRAAAATAVVFTHAITRISLSRPTDIATSLFRTKDGNQWIVGDIGVDLFFVISGFIMFYIHQSDFQKKGAVSAFILKRIIRIVPLYWIMTSLTIIILLIAPNLTSNGQRIDLAWLICSYLFVPFSSPSGVIAPVLGVGWTLNYEFIFYYIFGVSLLMNRSNALALISITVIVLVFYGKIKGFNSPLSAFYTSWLLCDFLGGVWVAWLAVYFGPIDLIIRRSLLIISFSVIAYTAIYPPDETGVSRLLMWGMPSIVIVLVAYNFQVGGLVGLIFRQAGNASYSIYLSQVFTLPFWAKILVLIGPGFISFDLAILMLTSLVIITGFVIWILVERPITTVVRRLILVTHDTAYKT